MKINLTRLSRSTSGYRHRGVLVSSSNLGKHELFIGVGRTQLIWTWGRA